MYISQSCTSERVRKPEGVVALPVPEEEAGEREEERERGRDDRVDLLAGVEPALGHPAAPKPGQIVLVEDVDLSRGRE